MNLERAMIISESSIFLKKDEIRTKQEYEKVKKKKFSPGYPVDKTLPNLRC